MIDLTIASIILSSISAIGVGILTIMRRVRIFRSCCCTTECDQDNTRQQENQAPIIIQPRSATEDEYLFSRVSSNKVISDIIPIHSNNQSPLNIRKHSPIRHSPMNPLYDKPQSTL